MDKTYEQAIWEKGISVFRGKHEWARLELDALPKSPIIAAFLADDDIQEITICSANLGIVNTYQKRYAKAAVGEE
jgi:hypothetical protein